MIDVSEQITIKKAVFADQLSATEWHETPQGLAITVTLFQARQARAAGPGEPVASYPLRFTDGTFSRLSFNGAKIYVEEIEDPTAGKTLKTIRDAFYSGHELTSKFSALDAALLAFGIITKRFGGKISS